MQHLPAEKLQLMFRSPTTTTSTFQYLLYAIIPIIAESIQILKIYWQYIIRCIRFQVEMTHILFNLYTWLNYTTSVLSNIAFCRSFLHLEIPLTPFSSKRGFFFFNIKINPVTETFTLFLIVNDEQFKKYRKHVMIT